MSQMDNGMTGPQGPDMEPPPIGGDQMLPSDFKLPERPVVGVASQKFSPTREDIRPLPPGPGLAPPQSPQGGIASQFGYIGQNLVDGDGIISRGQYVVGGDADEAKQQLSMMSTKQRIAFLNNLYAVGIYGRSRPSTTGLSSRDISAMRQAMMYANTKGVTLDVAQTLMAAEFGRVNTGRASVRTTPKQDLAEVYKQVTLNTLGRIPTQGEVDRFVRSYQSAQVTEAMGGQQAPNVQVAAEAQVSARNADEEAAMGAAQLAQIMDRAIKELA